MKKKKKKKTSWGEKKSLSRNEHYEDLRKRLKQLKDELKQTRSQPNNCDENINYNRNHEEEIVVVNVTPLDLSKNNGKLEKKIPKFYK